MAIKAKGMKCVGHETRIRQKKKVPTFFYEKSISDYVEN